MPWDNTMLLYVTAVLMSVIVIETNPTAAQDTRCPFGCDCRYATKVHCRGRLWTDIPHLPTGSSSLSIDEAYIPKLSEENFHERNCEHLTSFALTHSHLATVDDDTFKATPILQTLQIARNKLIKLHPTLFSFLRNVSYLDISYNFLQVFPETSLCELHNLQHAVLGKNPYDYVSFQHCCWREMHQITSVYLNMTNMAHATKDTWIGLQWSNVEILSLESCKVQNLTADFFHHLQNLVEINLTKNNLTHLGHRIFMNLLRLERIFIAYNPFITIDFSVWKNSQYLSTLEIGTSHLNIENLDFSNLSVYKHLKHFYVRSSKFEKINDQFISIGNNSSIRVVLIEFCGLRHIYRDAFKGLRSLISLQLPSNRLNATSIRNLTFGLSDTVKQLNFHKNHIENLPDTLFEGLSLNSSVESVQMSLCFISGVLPLSTFKRLPNISRLDFYKNEIQSVAPYRLATVRYIDMSYNSMNQITVEFMCSFPNLVGLDLSWNSLNHRIPRTVVNCTTHLEQLYLQRCNIMDLSGFNLFPKLKTLDLSNNYIRDINNITTLELKSLTRLHISGNPLHHSLPVNMFVNFKNLILLNLSDLSIASISPSLFRPLINLQSLDISSNTLENIQVNSFSNATYLRHIKFTNNPLICSCDMLSFFRYLHKKNIYAEGIADPLETTCLQSGVEINFIDFNLTDEDCRPDRQVTIIIVAFISVCFLSVILSIIYRYRWYLRYGCYAVKRNVYNYYNTYSESTFLFDAFVSCSSHDLPWVMDEMVPAVETKQDKKLCIYSRNWLAGKEIVDYIVHSIDASRRVVLVVTNNFAKSTWCSDEMQLARSVCALYIRIYM